MMFLIIAKFEEILLTETWLNCKSGKNFADSSIFSCVPSYIFRLAHRNFIKLTRKLCLMMFLIIAEFEEILLTETWLKLQIW